MMRILLSSVHDTCVFDVVAALFEAIAANQFFIVTVDNSGVGFYLNGDPVASEVSFGVHDGIKISYYNEH